MLKKLFCDHPNSVKQTYLQHLWWSCCASFKALMVAIVLILHGIFPFIFEKTGSNLIIGLASKFQTGERKKDFEKRMEDRLHEGSIKED